MQDDEQEEEAAVLISPSTCQALNVETRLMFRTNVKKDKLELYKRHHRGDESWR